MCVDGQGEVLEQSENSEQSIGTAETVRALIENGADVNANSESCVTPLHLASFEGNYETMEILIEHGADVTAKDTSDRTPMHLVSSWVCLTVAVTFHSAHTDVKNLLDV